MLTYFDREIVDSLGGSPEIPARSGRRLFSELLGTFSSSFSSLRAVA